MGQQSTSALQRTISDVSVNVARQIITDLRDERLDQIADKLQGSVYKFDEPLAALKVIRRLAEGLVQQNPLEISNNVISNLPGQRQQLDSFVQQLESFQPTQPDAAQQHANITAQIEQQREWWVQTVRPAIRPLDDLSTRTVDIELARVSAREAAAEIEGLLTQVRGAAGVVAADSLSGYYKSSAEAYSTRARNFLIASAISLAILAALAIYAFLVHAPPVHSGSNKTEDFIRSVLVRLLFLGIAGAAVAFASRNYRVSKHLQVVNEAKRNALNTYALFAKAAPTAEAQTIITAELVRSVFGLGDTGFLDSTGDKTIVEAQPLLTSLLHR
jgi:hypothetical protein